MLSLRARTHAAAESARPGSAVPGLDAAALARLAELDPTGQGRLIERVLEAFKTSAARLRPQMEAARRVDDHAAVRLVTHTLKSSSASIGALAFSAQCAEIENAIRLGTVTDLGAHLDAFDRSLDQVLEMIDRTLKATP